MKNNTAARRRRLRDVSRPESWLRRSVLCAISAVAIGALPAHSQTRTVFEDYTTQMSGSDHAGSLGSALFGDRTDLYSGATSFLVTDVSLPGNSDLPVALQRSLNAADTGLDCFGPQCGPDAFMTWTRFEVPYLSGGYPDGWVAATQSLGHIASTQRCSLTNGPPEIPDDKGIQGEWMVYEYWHGNHLYLPGAGSQQMLGAGGGSPPTDGQTYRWMTKDHWYFSCLPTTANGQPGEAFLARSPDGKKYRFDHLVSWRPVSELRKFDDEQDEMVLTRDEYRLLLTRVEDRFGNWVQYAYSGNDLTSITASDGRQLTLTYAAPGGALTSVSDGTRTWTYSYTNGVRVTHPDSTIWHATLSGPGIQRQSPTGCGEYANVYTGEATLTITHRSGAVGTFLFRPLRRGLSHVFYQWQLPDFCPSIPKYYDNVALYGKTITGTGVQAATWSYVYGPANACHAAGAGETTGPCTAASPTTRYVEVNGPGTFTRYTFGNKWEDTDGALFRIETGSSPSLILRDEALTWQTFQAPGSLGNSAGGNFLSTLVRTVATRTIVQGGATYATTNSNWDTYFNPQTVAESGPNGGSRTTQYTYHNDRAKWVIGQMATSTSPGRSISRTFNANSVVSSVTRDGVITSYTYHADGNVATVTYPRSLVHSFSSYKRGIPQSESQPDAVSLSRVVSDAGFITSQTDGEGRTRIFGRDAAGRVTSIDYPIGNDATVAYTGATKSLRTATRGGLIEAVSYDALRRPTAITRGGITTTYQYDAYGRVIFQSNPGNTVGTQYSYDALGRLSTVTHSDTSYRSFQYGPGTTTVRDERGNYTTYTHRRYGDPGELLLMGITAPAPSANLSLGRAANGLITSIVQAGQTRTFGYDTRNYLITETNPETGTTTYERDAAGNMTARLIGGTRVDFSYDGHNRLIGSTYSGGTTPATSQTWSKTGRLRSASSSVASRILNYDANDNLTSESLTVGGVPMTALYGYNGNDQLSTITYPISQRVVSYAPDALGRPTQVSGHATTVTHWPSGQLRQIDYANGTVTNHDENLRLWPSTFSVRRGSVYSVSSTYGYDNAGNLTAVVDAVDGNLNRSFGYDTIDRLTSASGPWGAGTIGYDGGSNITSQSLGSFGLSYVYDTQNRLSSVSGSRSASYTYDVFGNIATAGGAGYTYDNVPNLRCANCSGSNRVDYSYDGVRKRVTVTESGTTTYEFIASNGDLLVEYTPSAANKLVEHIYLEGKRIAQRVSDQTPPTALTIPGSVAQRGDGGVTLTVWVGGASPTGTVTFTENGVVIGTALVMNGQASIDVLGLALGTHTITVTYSGDASHSGNSVVVQIKVINLDWLPAVLDLILQ